LRDVDGVVLPRDYALSDMLSGNSCDVLSMLENPNLPDDSADFLFQNSAELIGDVDTRSADFELLAQCPIFTRRERERINHLRRQIDEGRTRINLSLAAHDMGIAPDTAYVHYHNIKKKRPNALAWLQSSR
jgi:hypothetical protein